MLSLRDFMFLTQRSIFSITVSNVLHSIPLSSFVCLIEKLFALANIIMSANTINTGK